MTGPTLTLTYFPPEESRVATAVGGTGPTTDSIARTMSAANVARSAPAVPMPLNVRASGYLRVGDGGVKSVSFGWMDGWDGWDVSPSLSVLSNSLVHFLVQLPPPGLRAVRAQDDGGGRRAGRGDGVFACFV